MGLLGTAVVQGALRQERRFSTISNNLANSQTVGFKKDVSLFKKILSQSIDPQKEEETEKVVTSFLQGQTQTTGNPLDLAIDGPGFFKVKTPSGVRYTRAGNFRLNQDRVLINANGFPVLGKSGEITVNGRNIEVAEDGSITVDGNTADQISLVNFPDLSLLRKEGQTLMKWEGPPKELDENQGRIMSGALESSNVNVIEEMLRMMETQRSYEYCLKVIQTSDDLTGKAVNELGRL